MVKINSLYCNLQCNLKKMSF